MVTQLLEVAPGVGVSDIQSIITSVTGQFSVGTIVAVLAAGIAAAATFVFLYWGARKLLGMLMAGVKKGKVQI